METDRTIYTILDEQGEKTTISLYKFTADILQAHLPDVHAWVQTTFNAVAHAKPYLSRREQGDVVRVLANNKILETPAGKALLVDMSS